MMPSRRAFFGALSAGVASVVLPPLARAEPTLIEGSESSGTGVAYPAYQGRRTAIETQASSQMDWRQSLLSRDRSLWLQRDATGESSRLVYWRPDVGYVRDGYSAACQIMRDVRANRVAFMDPVLLDLLCGMQGWLQAYGYNKPIILLSGFRSAETNSRTEGAARNSKHLSGQAADIVIPGLSQATIGTMAIMFNNGARGGVGFYPNNGFVHVDTGHARTWVTASLHSTKAKR